jgi:carboxylesterase
MGEYLANLGYSVLGVRIAGHATQPEDMRRMNWQDWAASVEDGYYLLKGIVDHVFMVGLSMGGILSLRFAAHLPVSGVVAMATPFTLPEVLRLPYIEILSPLIPWIKQNPLDFQNKEAASDHVYYHNFPSKAIIQLRDLLSEMQVCLPQVTVPVLLIYSHQDKSVPPPNAAKVFAALGSKQKKLVWVENSSHNIPREPDREIAFKATDDFIRHVIGIDQPQ